MLPMRIIYIFPHSVFPMLGFSINRNVKSCVSTFVSDHTGAKQCRTEVISEAEKIVGYPTSYLSLRWLLSDEIANVALILRKLVDSKHQFLNITKNLLYGSQNGLQKWSLIVLLMSKAANHDNLRGAEDGKATGVLHSQRVLAEVTQIIKISHQLHKGIMNIYTSHIPPEVQNDAILGNKIALLSGDYLLASACTQLATLRNQDVVELMSAAVRDLSESEFTGRRDENNIPLPSRGMIAIEDWTRQTILSGGSLLGNSCKASLHLAKHDNEWLNQGYDFGKHVALAWQAFVDLETFMPGSDYVPGMPFNLTSAPVLFHLQNDESLFDEIDAASDSTEKVNYVRIHNNVSKGPGLALTKQLQHFHLEKAIETLKIFKESDASRSLLNIILTMGEL